MFLQSLAMLMVSCVSEQTLQEEWDAFVVEHQDCAADEDCIIVYPGCPLACEDVIAADAAKEANEIAIELKLRYEKGGRNCQYECAASGAAFCDGGTCAISEAAAP